MVLCTNIKRVKYLFFIVTDYIEYYDNYKKYPVERGPFNP